MKLLGLGNGQVRLPMTPMGEANVRKLEKAMKAYGLPV
jgi:dihydrodipicolinate synthase/N-acetylneuraminate lyase